MARFVRLYSLARLYFLDSPGQNQIPNQWSDFVSLSYAPNGKVLVARDIVESIPT